VCVCVYFFQNLFPLKFLFSFLCFVAFLYLSLMYIQITIVHARQFSLLLFLRLGYYFFCLFQDYDDDICNIMQVISILILNEMLVQLYLTFSLLLFQNNNNKNLRKIYLILQHFQINDSIMFSFNYV